MDTVRAVLAVVFAVPAVAFGLAAVWYLLEYLAFGLGFRLGTAIVAGALCLLFAAGAQLVRPPPSDEPTPAVVR